MYQLVASSTLPPWDFLVLLSVGQGSLITMLVLSQVMLSSCGLHPFCRFTRTMSRFGLELRLRLKLQYWLVKMARRNPYSKCRKKSIPPVGSLKFLLHRDGRHLLDFFKTSSFNNVSPPVWA